jgi:hypothetical protein
MAHDVNQPRRGVSLADPCRSEIGTALFFVRRTGVIHHIMNPDGQFHRNRLSRQPLAAVKFFQAVGEVVTIVILAMGF